MGGGVMRMGSSRCFAGRRYASGSSQEAALRKTALYDLHVAHGGKMVPFGGFHMPVQYSGLSVSASHTFTRTKASLFDVGHMVQRHLRGAGAAAFLERLTPSGISALETHRSTLSALLWEHSGGIVDDTIITRLGPEHFYVVTNAGCREKDDAFLGRWLADEGLLKSLPGPVHHEELVDWGLVALQGPLASAILGSVLADGEAATLPGLFFGGSQYGRLQLRAGSSSAAELSSPLLISRGGYTGEDGFEISIPPEETVAVTEALLAAGTPERLQLAGLGARDSLRLEAGMCLYGHDLDDSTTPVEAALAWIIPKARRNDYSFHGAATILEQLRPRSQGGLGVSRRRIGLLVDGAPAREGADIVDEAGDVIGHVTSGCPSPTLGRNIAMAYIQDGKHKAGTAVGVVVRGRTRPAVVTKMPFVPTKYWKGE
ncbi:glycine cleavage system t protein [Grosmannia clavigera kw1407]|uniref:Aminomethyltransferase n=1 Tax=Grosmannia clavigera (strain kw1407 / UAMH 11150) TaxID=655863 RepID=F0XSE2_GROCL|nr:glycine cleavage system t protein [Grosmannia clavigera kw1407]EFW99467.1 glycine cleavage system t protein [Grosmannia clavigera kw1407]